MMFFVEENLINKFCLIKCKEFYKNEQDIIKKGFWSKHFLYYVRIFFMPNYFSCVLLFEVCFHLNHCWKFNKIIYMHTDFKISINIDEIYAAKKIGFTDN